MIQLDLFAPRQERQRIEPDGSVCTDDQIEEVIELGDRKTGLRIQLAKHEGRWMWSTSFHTVWGGCGYRVGAKWGNFTDTLCNALVAAADEIRERAKRYDGGDKVISLLKQLHLDVLDELRAEVAA